MKILLFTVSFLVSFSFPAFAELKHDVVYERVIASQTIRCGYADWAPFLMVDPNNGEITGIMKDVMDEIGKRTGLKIEWRANLGWGEITTAANTNKIDLFCNTVWTDKAQLQNMTLSRPVFYSPTYVFARSDDTRFDRGYAAINHSDIRIVGIDGDTTHITMQDNFPNAKMLGLPNVAQTSELMASVVSGKADLFLADISLLDEYAKTNPGRIKRVKGKPLFIMSDVLVTRAGELQLKNMLDTVLQGMINDGFIKAALEKYKVKTTYAPMPDVLIPELSE